MYYRSPDLPTVPEPNIHDFLFNRPEQQDWSDYTLYFTGQRRSFREFVDRVRDGATALGADVAQGGLGLRPENGEIVGILSENCPAVITVPFALFSSYSTPYELKYTKSLVQATRIFASPSLLPLTLTSGLPADRIYLLEGENKNYTSYDQLISSARNTGIPRLPVRHATVMLSHGNIIHALLAMKTNAMEMGKVQEPLALDTPDGLQVFFNVFPVYYSMGLYIACLFNFFNPYTIVMLPKWNIDFFFDSVSNSPPSFAPASQTWKELNMATACPNSQWASPVQPLPGMLDGCAKVKPGSVGILFPGVEARIIRPDGSLAGPKRSGGTPHTRGRRSAGIQGKRKGDTGDDTLKISGMQVSPVEIEDTILSHPTKLITDVTVAGVSGGRTSDERIPREKEVVSRLDAWVRERLNRYKWLRGEIGSVETVDSEAADWESAEAGVGGAVCKGGEDEIVKTQFDSIPSAHWSSNSYWCRCEQ
ncbi:hypothetical protein DFH29DRAFT_870960 [Suillus ampliporus]|nr:hypothetical protein DFH29DRAFT_870960 [Suillus ampliporus]